MWGPWINHNGKGCPCIGAFVEVEALKGPHGPVRWTYIAGSLGAECRSWDWTNYPRYSKITRYRVRKPKGLVMLQEIAMGVRQPEKV